MLCVFLEIDMQITSETVKMLGHFSHFSSADNVINFLPNNHYLTYVINELLILNIYLLRSKI